MPHEGTASERSLSYVCEAPLVVQAVSSPLSIEVALRTKTVFSLASPGVHGVRAVGDTYLPCQLGKQPPEPIVNVVLAHVDLEGAAQKEQQRVGRRGAGAALPPGPPAPHSPLPLTGLTPPVTAVEVQDGVRNKRTFSG